MQAGATITVLSIGRAGAHGRCTPRQIMAAAGGSEAGVVTIKADVTLVGSGTRLLVRCQLLAAGLSVPTEMEGELLGFDGDTMAGRHALNRCGGDRACALCLDFIVWRTKRPMMSGWTLGVAGALHMGDQSVVPEVRPESGEAGSLDGLLWPTRGLSASSIGQSVLVWTWEELLGGHGSVRNHYWAAPRPPWGTIQNTWGGFAGQGNPT
eukprot:SAG22_NODE_736_length_7533_cov_9.168281_4_plen_209_part_00